MLAVRSHRTNLGKSKMEIRKPLVTVEAVLGLFLIATHGFMLRFKNVTWLCFE
jgi:hypothetical protein